MTEEQNSSIKALEASILPEEYDPDEVLERAAEYFKGVIDSGGDYCDIHEAFIKAQNRFFPECKINEDSILDLLIYAAIVGAAKPNLSNCPDIL